MILARGEVRSATFEATVIRCGCGNPDTHNGIAGPAGQCPTPSAVQDLGVIAHKEQ